MNTHRTMMIYEEKKRLCEKVDEYYQRDGKYTTIQEACRIVGIPTRTYYNIKKKMNEEEESPPRKKKKHRVKNDVEVELIKKHHHTKKPKEIKSVPKEKSIRIDRRKNLREHLKQMDDMINALEK